MADIQPTKADVVEAQAILQHNRDVRREGTTAEVNMINLTDEKLAKDVMRRAKELGVKPSAPAATSELDKALKAFHGTQLRTRTGKAPGPSEAKNKGGPIQKRPQMMHGGAYKGKKHAYTAGGSVNNLKMMRK